MYQHYHVAISILLRRQLQPVDIYDLLFDLLLLSLVPVYSKQQITYDILLLVL